MVLSGGEQRLISAELKRMFRYISKPCVSRPCTEQDSRNNRGGVLCVLNHFMYC